MAFSDHSKNKYALHGECLLHKLNGQSTHNQWIVKHICESCKTNILMYQSNSATIFIADIRTF